MARSNGRKSPPARRKEMLKVNRVFSDAKQKPFDQIEWDQRTAEITDDSGKTIFRQENVEVPKFWSQLATKVVVSKYFYGEQGTPERNSSIASPARSRTGGSRTVTSARRTARCSTTS